MGMDKEAIDIWKFGRPRPDLSFDEVLAALEPVLTDFQRRRREADLSRRHRGRMKELLAMAPDIIAVARAKKAT